MAVENNNQIKDTIVSFLQNILQNSEFSSELVDILSELAKPVECPQGSVLLKAGSYCKYLFIIQKGFARRYSLSDGKDITLEFAQEHELISSQYSIIAKQPSMDYIETLEDSIILKINFEDIIKLYNISREALVIGRLMRDNHYLKLEKRILSLQSTTARERYNNLLKNHPHIIKRASLGQIASYLGMTQENLSRVRRKK
ncbi:Crp/Fnr family transcriptional regulator [Prolixibacteraceae bacterium JC049]|nr:Crp/Fnr family transcriptional regulator [Prolixibacteraceae bacterium JC049]